MNALQISISGAVEASNFDEWKGELLVKLEEAKSKELKTDDDFADAAQLVKSFKTAEDNLKKAKQEALYQVADIQALFDAIDEVVDKARETRLALNKQVTTRKDEIKEEVILAGLERVKLAINAQPDYFSHQDHTTFLDRARFVEATKRKTTKATLQAAVDNLCLEIEAEVASNAAMVEANKHRLEQLPPADRELFPDLHSLVAQQPETVEQEIEDRLSKRRNREAARHENTDQLAEVVVEKKSELDAARVSGAEKFTVVLDISADEMLAKNFVEQLVSQRFEGIIVSNARLERRPNSSWDDAFEYSEVEFHDLLKIYRDQQHDVPEVGFEVSDKEGRVTDLVLPLAWPERRFGVVSTEAEKQEAIALGWDAMLLQDAMVESMQDG